MEPLTLAEFSDLLRIRRSSIFLPGVRESSRTAGGDVISSILGSSLWQGSVEVAPARHGDIAGIQALLSEIDRTGTPFLFSPRPLGAPQSDPAGTTLGAATPRLSEVGGAGLRLRVAGLPAGYKLKRGDFLSFTYSSNPTRYAFHQLLEDAGDPVSGQTPFFKITPRVQGGYVAGGVGVGAAVQLVKPRFKAIIVPNSIKWGDFQLAHGQGISFDFIQTLR